MLYLGCSLRFYPAPLCMEMPKKASPERPLPPLGPGVVDPKGVLPWPSMPYNKTLLMFESCPYLSKVWELWKSEKLRDLLRITLCRMAARTQVL
ncbi:unnamed protein product [Nyctereutes procyonoides]|uniref:(raccoon dog) hypothetical protein n=1 Tax=Nyctereutes procyonoides TaxID=34880 RepID=A0A811YUR1_NYCPR|nr:unnamed protein product [Nyctereutes procyonoides]